MGRKLGVLVACVAALVVTLAGGAGVLFVLQPTSYRIARSRTIHAPPSAIRAVLSDMSRFSAVAQHLAPPDPSRTMTISPMTVGPGAWLESHGDGGASRLTLFSASDERIELETRIDGAEAGARLLFELRLLPAGTEVTVSLSNEMHGLARALWPFVDLDGRVGPNLADTLRALEIAVISP